MVTVLYIISDVMKVMATDIFGYVNQSGKKFNYLLIVILIDYQYNEVLNNDIHYIDRISQIENRATQCLPTISFLSNISG